MQLLPDGRVRVETPPAPRTGQPSLALDVLEFIHRLTTQIPDPRRHLIRYHVAYVPEPRNTQTGTFSRLAGEAEELFRVGYLTTANAA